MLDHHHHLLLMGHMHAACADIEFVDQPTFVRQLEPDRFAFLYGYLFWLIEIVIQFDFDGSAYGGLFARLTVRAANTVHPLVLHTVTRHALAGHPMPLHALTISIARFSHCGCAPYHKQ
jgi:hypothetical protein